MIHPVLGLVIAGLFAFSADTQAANTERGAQLYTARCGACHAIDENGPGPMHRGLIGCRAATQPGYEYSTALSQSGIIWSEVTLDRWLRDPNAYVPGNHMQARLADDPRDRADIISYLSQASLGAFACSRTNKPSVDDNADKK